MERERYISESLTRIKTLIGSDEISPIIKGMLDDARTSLDREGTMGIVGGPLNPSKVIDSARFQAEFLDQPTRLAESPEGIVALDTIEWLIRPALLIKGGKVLPLSAGPWKGMSAEVVASQADKICRIDIGFKGQPTRHLGSGFLLTDGSSGFFQVVTNAHVLDGALRLGWLKHDEIEVFCDFNRTSVAESGRLFPVSRNYARHDQHDLAVLYLESNEELSHLARSPLVLCELEPDPVVGVEVGVIGHPYFDSRVDPFPRQFGFDDQFGVKRLSPGTIRSLTNRQWLEKDVPLFLHDATTLSGNSGSCVTRLGKAEVLGLHFGGWPLPRRTVSTPQGDAMAELFEANGAVPLWSILEDPIWLKRP